MVFLRKCGVFQEWKESHCDEVAGGAGGDGSG